jgi:integrase
MSVERVERKTGVVWRVRWREGGRNRSKVLGRKRDAEAFDAEVRRRQRTGALATLDAGRERLDEFAEEWWRVYAVPNLAASTLRRYAEVWDRHVLPRVGGYRLREVTPAVVDNLRVELATAGVGAATIRKVLFLLQGILRLAVVRGHIAVNPVTAVKKPRQVSREVRPLAPKTVERMRSNLGHRDATLVSLLAYAGLRPGEALALKWSGVRDRTLLVHATKTHTTRTVRLLAPLASDLAEWRLACGRPAETALICPRPEGGPWRDHDFRNWRKRAFRPATVAAGVGGARPYDLRHSFVSLLIQEGVSIVEVARQAGHSPEECLRTYAHVFEEFDPSERVPAEAAIRAARVPVSYRERKSGGEA